MTRVAEDPHLVARPGAEDGDDASLLDLLLPCYDAVRAEHAVLPIGPGPAYRAVLDADFARAASRSGAVRLLFATRGRRRTAKAAGAGREGERLAGCPEGRGA